VPFHGVLLTNQLTLADEIKQRLLSSSKSNY